MGASENNAAARTRILSLEECRALLSLYEAMLEVAHAQDWERLSGIESQAAAIRDAALVRPGAPPETENIEELTRLLTRIQRLDHDIRSQTEPARDEARRQLAVEVKDRVVREAYGNLDASDN
jgi:flagellar protein FliT